MSHLQAVADLLAKVDHTDIMRVAAIIRDIKRDGGVVYIAGNGGSSATASHLANDLIKAEINAVALGQNAAVLSAQANDYGYDKALVNELKAHMSRASSPNAIVTMSVSGTSPNIRACLRLARSVRRLSAIQLVGASSDIMQTDIVIQVPSGVYEEVEDVHSTICHAIAREIKYDVARETMMAKE